ncbi:MAG: right-handed parallel beta-helix repeat-containing protein [Phycisphaeraceae bacterium]
MTRRSLRATMRLAATWTVLALAGVSPLLAGEYVVDAQHPAASDQNPGTSDEPWRTVQHAADTVEPGDTVYVMEGQYDEQVLIRTSGRAEAPILFKGVPQWQARIHGLETRGASRLRIEGFHFVNDGVRIAGHDIEVVGNLFENLLREMVAGTGENIRVAYNRGYRASAGVTARGRNWLVEANEVERMVHARVECDYGRFFGDGHTFRRNYFHGTRNAEVARSHVDGFQTWHRPGRENERARDMSFIDNVVYHFDQGLIARDSEGGPYLSSYVIRGNIFAHGMAGAEASVGIILQNVPDVTIEHNLVADIKWFGFSPSGSTSGRVRHNIVYQAGAWDRGRRPADLAVDHNLAFRASGGVGEHHIDADPRFIDADNDNWRLKSNSPAIDAGTDGATLGPFAWPNQYVVDNRHPGASDRGLGHPGRPFKTLAHALTVAASGETIIVYGGVYREQITATADDVTLTAAKGQTVILSGADRVAGWQRDGEGWSAPLAEAPRLLIRDGEGFDDFTHDGRSGRIKVQGFDPRLSTFETVVRPHALDMAGKRVHLKGITFAHTIDPRRNSAASPSP